MPAYLRVTHLLRAHAMDTPNPLPKPKQQRAQILKNILLEFGLIIGVYYEPFKCKPKQIARALLSSSFPQNLYLFDYFSLFFTYDLLRIITINTNRYASIQKLRV
jgi:hypothetical protein